MRPPGSHLTMSAFTRAWSASLPRADVKMAAALAAGLPRVRPELEAGRLEGAVVHAARDPAQARHVGFRHARLLPGVLERAPLQRDVERARVAALDPGREHPSLVGDRADEGVTQAREVGGPVPREGGADLRAARVDRARQDLGRLAFAQRAPHL